MVSNKEEARSMMERYMTVDECARWMGFIPCEEMKLLLEGGGFEVKSFDGEDWVTKKNFNDWISGQFITDAEGTGLTVM